mmetsp:Transcript_73098/g.133832  ORF Transcript_73098/g.133832 Transcript_73098/m.133832 type:complete len:205 (+) Transcript_73098:677-1291(+)
MSSAHHKTCSTSSSGRKSEHQSLSSASSSACRAASMEAKGSCLNGMARAMCPSSSTVGRSSGATSLFFLRPDKCFCCHFSIGLSALTPRTRLRASMPKAPATAASGGGAHQKSCRKRWRRALQPAVLSTAWRWSTSGKLSRTARAKSLSVTQNMNLSACSASLFFVIPFFSSSTRYCRKNSGARPISCSATHRKCSRSSRCTRT